MLWIKILHDVVGTSGYRCRVLWSFLVERTKQGIRRVKRLEKKRRSRTHGLKRLYKFRLSARVESSTNKKSLGEEDASKQGRISDIDANQDIYFVNVHRDEDIFGVNDQDDTLMFDADKDLQGEEVIVEEVNAASITTIVTVVTAAATTVVSFDELTMAQALVEIKILRPKAKELLAAKEAQKELEANNIVIEQWHDIQAKVDADYELAQRLQAEEQEQLIDAKKNMDGWKPRALKNKSFVDIQDLFNKTMARINNVVDFRTELVKERIKKDKAETVQERSLKREKDKLE
nr:hypothetical protein [Tanacetum cinerariifolium]